MVIKKRKRTTGQRYKVLLLPGHQPPPLPLSISLSPFSFLFLFLHKKKTHLVLDQGGEREVVKELGKIGPNVGRAVFPQALVV